MRIFDLIKKEEKRQAETLMLIPSENYTSKDIREALGSCLTHKYSEGYPGRRYYQGNKFVDKIEEIAIERAKKLFSVPHANVQAYSGSSANAAILFALLNPGDKIMGMSLSSGGHLTHGHPKITFSGKFFKSVQYEVNENGFIDYDKVYKLAKGEKPKLIIAGITAYSRVLDFKKFEEIADSVGAYLLADISHIAGLIVAGVHSSPTDYAHIVMTTTHKTLRGPRGAIIMVTSKGLKKDSEMGKKIDRAIFPGLQGGPHDNQIAAIAIALEEAGKKKFQTYGKRIVENAKALADSLSDKGFKVVTGGTENHMVLLDLSGEKILGKLFAVKLEKAGIIVNANAIPHDPYPPFSPSGVRLGTPAVTSRKMGPAEMKKIAEFIYQVSSDPGSVSKVKKEVQQLTKKFPIPDIF